MSCCVGGNVVSSYWLFVNGFFSCLMEHYNRRGLRKIGRRKRKFFLIFFDRKHLTINKKGRQSQNLQYRS